MTTDEEREVLTKSVLIERDKYAAEGDNDNVAHCDHELERLGAGRKPTRKSGSKR